MSDSLDPYATPESSLVEAAEASRVRRKKTLVILGATGGALLIFVLMVAVLMTSESYPVNEEDRRVLVTIEDLAVWLDAFEPVGQGAQGHARIFGPEHRDKGHAAQGQEGQVA